MAALRLLTATAALLSIRIASCVASPLVGYAGEELTPPALDAADPSPTPSGSSRWQLPAVEAVKDVDERQFDSGSGRYLAGFVDCPCTASGRSFNVSRVMSDGEARRALLAGDREGGRALFARCVARHRFEACVNWAAAAVLVGGARMCALDRETYRSVVSASGGRWRTTGRCDERSDTRSPPEALLETELLEEIVDPRPSPEAGFGGYGGERAGGGRRDGEGDGSLFEGCVAVEHLRGAQLQHPWNLKRRVLCAENGLCATARHVVVADGRRATMQALCSGKWRCRVDARWVNNIRLSHRVWAPRGVSGNVLVTPYHAWVPRPLHWVLAVMEDIVVLLCSALWRSLQIVCAALFIEKMRRGLSWVFAKSTVNTKLVD